MKLGSKIGVCMLAMLCWATTAVAADDAGSKQKKPLTYEEMVKKSSADLIRRTDATAEEDYLAGTIARDRMEVVEAQGLFERAAKKGHTGAMVSYADMLFKGGFVDEAVASYRKAAELGNPEGQYSLGTMYMDLGNYDWKNLDSQVRPLEARKWIMKAAEQGYPAAINLLAQAYASGGLGLTDADRTDTEVLNWLHKSADTGDGQAMENLSKAYRTGKYGLAVDAKLADEWADKSKKAYGIKEQDAQKKKRKRRI